MRAYVGVHACKLICTRAAGAHTPPQLLRGKSRWDAPIRLIEHARRVLCVASPALGAVNPVIHLLEERAHAAHELQIVHAPVAIDIP